jgi:hypothetical protein
MSWAVARAPTPPLRNACDICAAQNGGMAAASLARSLPRIEVEPSSNPQHQATSAGVRPRSPRAGRPMAGGRAFGALASRSRKHCLWVAANFTTDVRCRSLAAIVAAHRRARAATFNLLALEIQVCARPQTHLHPRPRRPRTDAAAAWRARARRRARGCCGRSRDHLRRHDRRDRHSRHRRSRRRRRHRRVQTRCVRSEGGRHASRCGSAGARDSPHALHKRARGSVRARHADCAAVRTAPPCAALRLALQGLPTPRPTVADSSAFARARVQVRERQLCSPGRIAAARTAAQIVGAAPFTKPQSGGAIGGEFGAVARSAGVRRAHRSASGCRAAHGPRALFLTHPAPGAGACGSRRPPSKRHPCSSRQSAQLPWGAPPNAVSARRHAPPTPRCCVLA